MVVAAAATRNPTKPRKSSSPSPGRQDPQNPCRLPLIPSEKDNAGDAVRRSRTKEISSRNLSSFSSSSASSNSTSYSAASNFSSPSSSSSSRRFPSPFANFRPSTPPALRQSSSQKRSCSADRARPSTPAGRGVPREAEPSVAANTLCTTTRSLSVSFQGESFFYQTSRAKTVSPSTPTPERRRPVAAVSAAAKTGDHLENSRPFDSRHRWPASRALPSNSLMRSSSCSSEKKEQILATVRLLHQTMLFDDSTRRISFDGGDLSASSDTDSVSSGSNSGTPEFSALSRAKVTSRGISVPARYRQEINSRLRQYPEPCSPSPNSKSAAPKWSGTKKLSDSPLSYPSSTSSPLRGPMRPPSPSKLVASRGMSSPQRTQTNVAMSTSPIARAGNAPSIISFAAEVRRAKKGENRIEEAHLLRLLDNRHLQWRCVNSRANAALILQKLTIELAYLEEWSVIDTEHSSLLLGAIEALKASTLRLPIVSGAKMDILELKDSVGSAVDMMQAMGSSIRSLLSKKTKTIEWNICVKQCSLQGHLVQLKRKASRLRFLLLSLISATHCSRVIMEVELDVILPNSEEKETFCVADS
ncbi:hypothetical protein ZIOFF_069060 [Zingiber officinale]|uniref:QWRF motif-containing protein 2 n=1 Tax=Zingiber officinale TaxID=94328 RepID=A0A8J5BGB8_ZINOF|nr:hypothetical protein ZIOFF_069060 [Zingiber officinale]